MRIILTGDLGFSVDSEEVFSELDTKLLLATVLLVLFLLGAIYRAVLVALTPLLVVFFAYTAATAFVYLYAEVRGHGVLERDHDPRRADVRGGHRLLPVIGLALPRGAAPDRGQARRDGAGAAAHRADDPRQRPHGVAGDADPGARRRPPHLHPRPGGRDRRRLRDGRRAHPAPGAADDLRPPRLLAAGERRRLRPRARRGDAPGGLAPGRRPRPAAAGGRAGDHRRSLFVAGALGLLAYKVDYSTTTFFKKSVESVEGFELLEEAFPAGLLAPTTVLVQSDRRPDHQGRRRHRGAGRRGRRRRRHRDADRRGLQRRADGDSRRGPRGRPVHEGGVRRRARTSARASRTSAPG